MKEVQSFTINLENERTSFTGGEEMRGEVNLTLIEAVEIQGIKLQFTGETFCRWNDTHASKNGNRKPKTEKIINLERIIFGFKEGVAIESVPVHPSGNHSYDFAFHLPKSLPCSFESPKDRDWGLAYIQYSLTATIIRPWKSNVTKKIPINMNELIDTSLPEYAYRPGCQTQKELGSCLSDGILSVEVYLDSVCYSQGGTILISAMAENESNRIMSSVYAKLYRRTRYYHNNETKTYLDLISEYYGERVLPKQFIRWNKLEFKLPTVSPTLTKSKRIRVEYFMRVGMYQLFRDEIHVDLPIVIGTTIDMIEQKSEQDQQQIHWPTPIAVSSLARQDSSSIKQDRLEEIADIFMKIPYTGKRPSVQYISAVARKSRKNQSVHSTPRKIIDDSDASVSDNEKAQISKSADFLESGYYNEEDFLSPTSAMSSRRASETSFNQLSKSASVHFPHGETHAKSINSTSKPHGNEKEAFQLNLRKAASQSCIERQRPASTSSEKSTGRSQSPRKLTPRNRPTVRKSVSQGTIDMKTASQIAAGLGNIKRQGALKIRERKEKDSGKSTEDGTTQSQSSNARETSNKTASSLTMSPKRSGTGQTSSKLDSSSTSKENVKGELKTDNEAAPQTKSLNGKHPYMSPINSVAESTQSSSSKQTGTTAKIDAKLPVSNSPANLSQKSPMDHKGSSRISPKVLSSQRKQTAKARNALLAREAFSKGKSNRVSSVSSISEGSNSAKLAKSNGERKPQGSSSGDFATKNKQMKAKEDKKISVTRRPDALSTSKNNTGKSSKEVPETTSIKKGDDKTVTEKESKTGLNRKIQVSSANAKVTKKEVERASLAANTSIKGLEGDNVNDRSKMVTKSSHDTNVTSKGSLDRDVNDGDTAVTRSNVDAVTGKGTVVDDDDGKDKTVVNASVIATTAGRASVGIGVEERKKPVGNASLDADSSSKALPHGGISRGGNAIPGSVSNSEIEKRAAVGVGIEERKKPVRNASLDADLSSKASPDNDISRGDNAIPGSVSNSEMEKRAAVGVSVEERKKPVGNASLDADLCKASPDNDISRGDNAIPGSVSNSEIEKRAAVGVSVGKRKTAIAKVSTDAETVSERFNNVSNKPEKASMTERSKTASKENSRLQEKITSNGKKNTKALLANDLNDKNTMLSRDANTATATKIGMKEDVPVETHSAEEDRRDLPNGKINENGTTSFPANLLIKTDVNRPDTKIAREPTVGRRDRKMSKEKLIKPNGEVKTSASTTIHSGNVSKIETTASISEAGSDLKDVSESLIGIHSVKNDLPEQHTTNGSSHDSKTEIAATTKISQNNLEQSPIEQLEESALYARETVGANKMDPNLSPVKEITDMERELQQEKIEADENIIIPAVEQGEFQGAPFFEGLENSNDSPVDMEGINDSSINESDFNDLSVKDTKVGEENSKLIDESGLILAEKIEDVERERAPSLDEFEMLEKIATIDDLPNKTMSPQTIERRVSKIIIVDNSTSSNIELDRNNPLNIEIVVDKREMQNSSYEGNIKEQYPPSATDGNPAISSQGQIFNYHHDADNITKSDVDSLGGESTEISKDAGVIRNIASWSTMQTVEEQENLTEQQSYSKVAREGQPNGAVNTESETVVNEFDRNSNELPQRVKKAKLFWTKSLEKIRRSKTTPNLTSLSSSDPPVRRRSVVNIRVVNEEKPNK